MCEAATYELRETYLSQFRESLILDEKSVSTIEKYMRDILNFLRFLKEKRMICKQDILAYKEWLFLNYAVSSANSMLAALNCFLAFLGWHDCRVKAFKTQKQVFCSCSKELKREEYLRLVSAAEEKGDSRLALLIQTICSAGLRVSELACITLAAARKGVAEVNCKGKSRMVMLPENLCKRLIAYCGKMNIVKGYIFITRSGRPLDRSNIWKMMRALCGRAKVALEKVFPHNLRHLFARTFYDKGKDIIRLADILGHRSVDTTRIYTVSSGEEHSSLLESLHLLPFNTEVGGRIHVGKNKTT